MTARLATILFAGTLALQGCGNDDGETLDSATVSDTPQFALSDEAFRFCHEAGYDATRAKPYCDMLQDAEPGTCPGLEATCAGAQEVEPEVGCGGGGAGGGGVGAGEPSRPSFRAEPPECGCESPVPGGMAGFFDQVLKWVAAIFVAVLLVLLVRLLVRRFGSGTSKDSPVPVAEVVVETHAELEDVPDLPAPDLLAAARAALERGDFAGAVRLARGTALRALAEAGRLRLHRSRTDREYARSVRGQNDVHASLKGIFRVVEGWRFGGLTLGREEARGVLSAAERILQTVTVAVLAGALLLVPGTALGQERFSPQGDAGLLTMLEGAGIDAGWRLRGFDAVGDEDDLAAVVLDVSRVAPTEDEWQALLDWVDGGGGLLVVGDPGEAIALGLFVETEGVETEEGHWPGGAMAGWEDPEGVVAFGDQELAFVQWLDHGDGLIVAVADARILNNGSLVSPLNTDLLIEMVLEVSDGEGEVQLATWPGAADAADNPFESMWNAKMLAFVLQFLILLAVLAVSRGVPFAPLRDPPVEGRLRFVDHVVALGARWRQAKASRYAASSYAALWLGRLGRGGLATAAKRSGMDTHQASELVRLAEQAVAEPDDADLPQDLELVEALWKVTHRR